MAPQPKTKAVIFDFDGTIADSAGIFAESLVAVLKRPPLSADETAELRGKLSPREVMKALRVKKWQLPLFVLKGKREITKRMHKVEIFPGMPEALHELAEPGYKIYILSTNTNDNITSFLEKNKIHKYVDRVYADIGILGKAKNLKKLMKREKLSAGNCLYIGDEVRDVEAAKKAGIRCIAVKWGYSNQAALESHRPDALVTDPSELVVQIRRALNEV